MAPFGFLVPKIPRGSRLGDGGSAPYLHKIIKVELNGRAVLSMRG